MKKAAAVKKKKAIVRVDTEVARRNHPPEKREGANRSRLPGKRGGNNRSTKALRRKSRTKEKEATVPKRATARNHQVKVESMALR